MIVPVLLCGGSGTRLWPLSRKSYPKQFAGLLGAESLFQASARRLSGPGFAPPLVVTNAAFRFIVTEQLAGIGVDAQAVLIEPEGRSTGPAVLAAALWLERADPEVLMLVAPSDHVIPDAAAFRAALEAGAGAARAGRLVTFGIAPTCAETGYGWLELETVPNGGSEVLDLLRFVEKPEAGAAQKMLEQGRFLWNAGIFLFSVDTILKAFEIHAPDMIAPVRQALAQGREDLGFLRLDPEPWAGLDDISIDYAVMERADNLSVVPYSAGWSDLGDWHAVLREMDRDEGGVATGGNALALDCRDTLLRSEAKGLELVGIGLDGIVAIAMPDAVLVADASRTQEVKRAVAALKAKGAKQAEAFPKDHRPWGWFETLVLADRFQVKRIVVHPGAALSLQSHAHRAEHWIVVAGTAKVTIGDEVKLLNEDRSVYVPLGARHRLENPGKVDMVLIEVQTGSYLGEDDIIRYEDVYARDGSTRTGLAGKPAESLLKIEDTKLSGVKILTPPRHGDARGFFAESWNARVMAEHGLNYDFVQDNHSVSVQAGTLRGLHFQSPPHAQGKLVRCGRGALYDVAVDIQHGSPTYGQWVGVELSFENRRQLIIPAGFLHGFVTRVPDTEIVYKCTDYYSPDCDGAVRWDDPAIGINWGLGGLAPVLSCRDANAPLLAELGTVFTYSKGAPA